MRQTDQVSHPNKATASYNCVRLYLCILDSEMEDNVLVRTVAGILVRTMVGILVRTVAGILVRTVAGILVRTVAGILVWTVAGIPSVLHTRKFCCSPLFAICRTFTGHIVHRHVVTLSCLLRTGMHVHLVFSPFTARQSPLLATSHLSSLIISCSVQL